VAIQNGRRTPQPPEPPAARSRSARAAGAPPVRLPLPQIQPGDVEWRRLSPQAVVTVQRVVLLAAHGFTLTEISVRTGVSVTRLTRLLRELRDELRSNVRGGP
jgi:hypothetical protein